MEAKLTAPFSADLRKRLVGGRTGQFTSQRCGVVCSQSSVIKLVRRYDETGSVAPGKIRGHRIPILADQEYFLRDLTSSRKGITLEEIRETQIDRGAARCSLTTIWATLRRMELSFKKTLIASEQRLVRTSAIPSFLDG